MAKKQGRRSPEDIAAENALKAHLTRPAPPEGFGPAETEAWVVEVNAKPPSYFRTHLAELREICKLDAALASMSPSDERYPILYGKWLAGRRSLKLTLSTSLDSRAAARADRDGPDSGDRLLGINRESGLSGFDQVKAFREARARMHDPEEEDFVGPEKSPIGARVPKLPERW